GTLLSPLEGSRAVWFRDFLRFARSTVLSAEPNAGPRARGPASTLVTGPDLLGLWQNAWHSAGLREHYIHDARPVSGLAASAASHRNSCQAARTPQRPDAHSAADSAQHSGDRRGHPGYP